MLHVKSITYERVTQQSFEKAQKFIWEQCQLHYGDKIMPERYEALQKRIAKEMSRPECCAIFIALNEKDEVVGVIALSDYDDRIEAIKGRYESKEAAEMSRCYVHEAYRRCGIGVRLFELATSFAKEKGYSMLYLHTHYFLPGGFMFWSAMGFSITLDEGGVWQTVHMERLVEQSALCYA
ncbi:GNAT family N-acetyltransferase [Sulfurospirillum barnesii]|uniref:Putative acetyltransferase n=1 Tax=Sulfurospirillum barnesii (strain ATCC 700032 / DSM 10660 / SES-3) TaxID=760154 RepID=I3XZQ9_SULBS|nr:GNAT family N-acetyltransferase [Sulfurospirillum barnesii]AFL69433.1 putative acetyltransferase [Sulfurospirillum barnesii SES-3]